MQDFNTIIGVIQMRQNECSFSVIQKRYHIGSGTTQRILSRFEASGLTLEELRQMDPHIVEELIYACLSRMTAKAYRLECNGRDMRKTE